MRWPNSDAGAGSVLTLGVVAALAVALAGTLPIALLIPVKHRVKDAADAAALAAADAVSGRALGSPCESAGDVAEGNAVALSACQVDGMVVTVTAVKTVLGLRLSATSTAGPATPSP